MTIDVFFWIMLAGMNALTFALYGWDKRQARWKGWRVPEMVLLVAGLLGGSPAAFVAQKWFRHKTRKQPFQMFFWIIIALQVYAVMVVVNPPPS